MSWSILLLPLLVGYFYLSRSIKEKHYYKRIERQRLIFDSLLVGILFFTIAYILWFLAKTFAIELIFSAVFLTGVETPYFFPAALSLIIAIIYTGVFNLLRKNNENWYLAESIERTGNSLQKDFLKSYFFGELVMITLRNSKVYVGILSELHEPRSESSFIKIIPFYSGYRNDRMDVEFVTEYNRDSLSEEDIEISESNLSNRKWYEFWKKEDNTEAEEPFLNPQPNKESQDEEDSLEDDFIEVTIDESEIISLTFYDQDVFDKLNN